MHPLYSSTTRNRFLIFLIICLAGQHLAAQVPTISLVTPLSGPAGSSVTISGSNFSTIPANNTVYFGAVKAAVSAAAANALTVTVPAGATYQPITVTVNNLTAYSPLPFSVTFAGGGTPAASSFAPLSYYQTGSSPRPSAVIDFNSDGKADIVTVNNFSTTLSVLQNTSTTGMVSFAQGIILPGSLNQTNNVVGICDIDGDGKPDIAMGNAGNNSIYFYLNTSTPGTISFALPVILSNSAASGLAFADFGGDGRPDLAAVNYTDSVAVYKNNSTPGNISFGPKVNAGGGGIMSCVITGDFNSDGKQDMATGEYNNNRLVVFKNTGSGGVAAFGERTFYAANNYPLKLATGDFNEDGRLDIALTCSNGSKISLYKNTAAAGNLSFDPKMDMEAGVNVISIAVGNIDGDSKPDILTGRQNFFSINVFQNTSSGSSFSFGPATVYEVGGYAESIVPADLDNDGKADIASTNFSSFYVSVLRNRMSEPIVTGFSPTGGPAGTSITITGSRFTTANAVTIGGAAVSSFNVVSDTSITAIVGSGASGSVVVTNAFGTGSKPGFTFGPAPVITSFSPTAAGQGVIVQVKGTGLTGATAASFGGVPGTFFFPETDTSISAMVASGASGSVSVNTPTGTASLPGFSFLPIPTISRVSPDSGFSGATITIIGTSFTGATSFRFGGIPAASFTVLTDTSILAVVGNGATGSITIRGAGGSYQGAYFKYLGPDISSFTPQSGGPGTVVSISGTNFTGVTAVQFGGTPAASYTVNSTTSITAVTGIGATGTVTVTTATGTGTRGIFTAPPRITSFTPASGPVGTSITISGNSFSATPSGNRVYIGGVRAAVTAATTTSLTVTVPAGTSLQPISVRTNGFTGYSAQAFITTFTGGPLVPAFFAMRQPVSTGVFPMRTAMGDLDNDGKPELVTANSDGTLSVYKNNSVAGNAVFASPLNYTKMKNMADRFGGLLFFV